MKLEDAVEIDVPPQRVWAFLNDVPQVVPCMPGAELTEVVGEDQWKAKIAVKLGPIALTFASDVRRAELDAETRRVKLAINARELKGRGSARATVESSLIEREGGTRIFIVTDLVMQGAVAQYGRGIVGDVASQLTAQFADCVRNRLREHNGGAPVSTDPVDAAQTPATSGQAPSSTPVGRHPAGPAPHKPISGLRVLLRALWALITRNRRGTS